MSEPFIGQVEIFSFNFAPKGWAQCNGQLLPINQNQPLFALLGTMYGGDGRTTFGLPDLRSRVPISFGTNAQGSRAGEEAHTLLSQEMPQHIHALNADSTTTATTNSPGNPATTVLGRTSGAIMPNGQFTVNLYNASAPSGSLNPGVVSNTGNNQAHPNIMPYLVLNVCIALQGIFPSRN